MSALQSLRGVAALVDGDPARRIGDVRRVELTVQGGVVYRPAELEQELGIAPR